MISRFRTFLAGFFVLLPLAVTITVIVWVGTFIYAYVGPDSAIGRILISIGFRAVGFADCSLCAGRNYRGRADLSARAQRRIPPRKPGSSADRISLMQRIPFVRNLYDVTKRFVAIMDRRDQDGLKSMSPVWCFFGGDGGAGVLGLLPMPRPILIGGERLPRGPRPFRTGAGRRRIDLCPGRMGQASQYRGGNPDEHLCIDGRDLAANRGE